MTMKLPPPDTKRKAFYYARLSRRLSTNTFPVCGAGLFGTRREGGRSKSERLAWQHFLIGAFESSLRNWLRVTLVYVKRQRSPFRQTYCTIPEVREASRPLILTHKVSQKRINVAKIHHFFFFFVDNLS